jgi:hypothetical protein
MAAWHRPSSRIQSFVDGGELTSAILRLSVAGRGSAKRLAIVPIFDGFVEGKSTVGPGATWNCAEDADISDDDEGCLQQWPPSLFVDGDPRRPDQHDRRAGFLGWDVTEDVNAGAYAWAIRAASGHKGGHRGARGGAFQTRKGAAELRAPFRAPTLLLEREPGDDSAEPPLHDAAARGEPQPTLMMLLGGEPVERRPGARRSSDLAGSAGVGRGSSATHIPGGPERCARQFHAVQPPPLASGDTLGQQIETLAHRPPVVRAPRCQAGQ